MWASTAWAHSAAVFRQSSASRRPPTASADQSWLSRTASRWPGHDRAVLEKPRRKTSSSLRYDINPDITEVKSNVQRSSDHVTLCSRSAEGTRFLRRQARSRGEHRPGPRVHALANGERAGGLAPDPVGEARPSRP